MDQVVAPTLGFAPDRAIRGRLYAILIDGFLVGLIARALVPALGIDSAGGVLLALLAIQFFYFFLQEAVAGKTLGKRPFGLRITQLDGSDPTLQQTAIRSALRFVDALPLFYASGLISVMWTGPGRRQRLGDRVAGTSVVLERGVKAHTTPGWLLPVLTVAAVLLSIVIYGVAYNKYRAPNVSENGLTPVAVPGFPGMDNTQGPRPGHYSARATVNHTVLIDPATREPMVRPWQFTKRCSAPTSCIYKMTRQTDIGEESGELAHFADGWHLTFPTHAVRSRCPDGRITTVLLRASFVLRFDVGGQQVMAHERNLFRSSDCGTFVRALDWNAAPTTF